MVSSSKILTVSYGTFSCTVEGFDDPLDVVKETTHFFRGVVGEDRFFGAEPPQFDPELASEYLRDRLADSGGTLTLGSPPRVRTAAASAGAMAASFAADEAKAAPPDDLLPDDDTIEATAVLTERLVPDDAEVSPEILPVDTAPAEAEAAPAPRASAPDDIAAKLDRIRAVVAQAEDRSGELSAVEETTAEEELTAEEAEEAEFADMAPETEDATGLDLIFEEEIQPEHEISAELLADMAESGEFVGAEELSERIEETTEHLFDDLDEDEEETALEAEAPDVDSTGDDALETLLEELVVESADTEELDLDSLDDLDEEEDDDQGIFDDTVAALLRGDDTEATPGAGDRGHAGETQKATALAAAAAAVAALVGGKDKREAAPAEVQRDHEDWDTDDEDALDDAWTTEAATARPVPEDAAEFDWDEDEEDGQDDDLTAESEAEPVPAPSGTPVRARIVKVKRAALEKAIQDGTLEEVTDSPVVASPTSESSLSPEEEEELARELAAVKAELASDFGAWDEDDDSAATDWDDEDADESEDEDEDQAAAGGPLRLDNPIRTSDHSWDMAEETEVEAFEDEDDDDATDALRDSARKAMKLASPARALLTEQEVEDDDTSRLLDQTNSEMDEPEGNRRRSAIAHLRAAVAATKADRLLGRKADAAEEQEPYREDLATVVRPRRPQTVGARTERPASQPAAPLKLVAEQRIDAEEHDEEPAAAAAPVRPRRVRRSAPEDQAPADSQDDSGFASYARSVGANDLPELLEAAAAYMSYVEGRDQFSRPQLMTTLRQAEITDSSREDRLRSFGQLLREGKIRKTSGGRFTAAETISFKPAANG